MAEIRYVNELAEQDHLLRLHCISHKMLPNKKSDAFLLEYCGEFYLIDGGLPKATCVVEYLHRIRRALLKDHPHLWDDPSYKLRMSWIISHFHQDHVGLGIEKLLGDPYLSFGDIYLPPDSEIDGRYYVEDMDGDEKLRPAFLEALKSVSDPRYTLHAIPFGKEHRFTVKTKSGTGREVSLTFLPPARDLGVGWYLEYLYDLYTDKGSAPHRIPVSAVNNASVWVLVEFAGRKMLFTGDTMKREKHLYSEGLDLMMETYSEELGQIDVLKYVHHGFARNRALPAMMSMKPRLLIVSKTDSPIGALVEKRYPNAETEVLNVADDTLVITCRSDGEITYEWHEESNNPF